MYVIKAGGEWSLIIIAVTALTWDKQQQQQQHKQQKQKKTRERALCLLKELYHTYLTSFFFILSNFVRPETVIGVNPPTRSSSLFDTCPKRKILPTKRQGKP